MEFNQWSMLVLLSFSMLFVSCEIEEISRFHADGGDDISTDDPSSNASPGEDSDEPRQIECEHGELWCADNFVVECDPDGFWAKKTDCAQEGKLCAAGKCRLISTDCAQAMNERSYIGCEYFAAPFSNSPLNHSNGNVIPGEPFYFAVAIANDNQRQASIEITDGPGGEVDNLYEVPAGEMIVVEDLPWKKLIKEPYTEDVFQDRLYATRQIPNGAFYIKSDLPITVYQFNPLHYRANVDDSEVFSFTNDASLLLPTHVFLDEYMAISRPTQKLTTTIDGYDSESVSPGFLSIIGPKDGPTTLEIVTTSATFASDQYSTVKYTALAPGETLQTVTIKPFEVLQILSGKEPGCISPKVCDQVPYTDMFGVYQIADVNCCKAPRQFDLTGTTIKVVDGPAPAVFSGHNCTFVPFDRFACDHLEQQMLPLETWGTRYLCAHNITQRPQEPTVWRIVSGADNNEITFIPSSIQNTTILNKGDFIEFESLDDFEVVGGQRLAVAQFLVGQNYTGDIDTPENGDPAMAIGVPVEQYRRIYTFLAPETYAHNYLSVIHLTGEFPNLDGQIIAGDTVEIGTEYSRTNLEIEGGIHSMSADSPFGVTVYGVGSYTSYMYPAGMDLHRTLVI